jgi:hypothetical protein
MYLTSMVKLMVIGQLNICQGRVEVRPVDRHLRLFSHSTNVPAYAPPSEPLPHLELLHDPSEDGIGFVV